MSAVHYLGPSKSAIMGLPGDANLETYLSGATEPAVLNELVNSFGRKRSFYEANNLLQGYYDANSVWHAATAANAPTEWYNSLEFCNQYLDYNSSVDVLHNGAFTEPTIPIADSFWNITAAIGGPVGLFLGGIALREDKKGWGGGFLLGGGIGCGLSAYKLINYNTMYNSTNYMTKLLGAKGLCQTAGFLSIGTGAGMVLDGVYNIKNSSDWKGKLGGGLEMIGGGVLSTAGGFSFLNGVNNWVNTTSLGDAMYTMSVNPPIASEVLNFAPALGWISLIATGFLTVFQLIRHLKKPKTFGLGGF